MGYPERTERVAPVRSLTQLQRCRKGFTCSDQHFIGLRSQERGRATVTGWDTWPASRHVAATSRGSISTRTCSPPGGYSSVPRRGGGSIPAISIGGSTRLDGRGASGSTTYGIPSDSRSVSKVRISPIFKLTWGIGVPAVFWTPAHKPAQAETFLEGPYRAPYERKPAPKGRFPPGCIGSSGWTRTNNPPVNSLTLVLYLVGSSVPWLGPNDAGTRYSTPDCSQIVHGCVVSLLAPSRGGIASAAIMRRESAEVQPTDASLPVERFVEAGERL